MTNTNDSDEDNDLTVGDPTILVVKDDEDEENMNNYEES